MRACEIEERALKRIRIRIRRRVDGGRLICHAQTQAARDLGAAAVGDPHSALMTGRSGKLSLGW